MAPSALQAADQFQLVGGRGAGDDFVDADLARDVARGGFDVAGGHHRLHAEPVQQRDGLARAGPRPVGDGEQRHAAIPLRDEHRRLALFGERIGARLPVGAGDAGLFEQRGVADQQRLVLAARAHAAARDGLEIESQPWRHASRLAVGGDRARQEVFGVALGARDARQQFGLVVPSAATKSVTTGRPSVMVPVLSNTSVVSLAAVSSASPLRM